MKFRTLAIIVLCFFSNDDVFSQIVEKYEKKAPPSSGTLTILNSDFADVGDKDILRWASNSVSWYLDNTAGTSETPTKTQIKTAIENAYTSWANVSTASITFSYSGEIDPAYGYDSKNVHYFAQADDTLYTDPDPDEDPSIRFSFGAEETAFAVLTIDSDGYIIDADVIYNGREWDFNVTGNIDANNFEMDVQTVATHEIGHTIGIHHTQPDGTSSPYTTMNLDVLEIGQKTLDTTAERAVSFLYGGNILANQTLDQSNSYMDWNWTVKSGVTLTLPTGKTLNLGDNDTLRVNGKFKTTNATVVAGSESQIRIWLDIESDGTNYRGSSSGAAHWAGIRVQTADGGTADYIKNGEIKDAENAIYLYTTHDMTVDDVNIGTATDSVGYGVRIIYGKDNIIKNNTITNAEHYGILSNSTSNLTIQSNTIKNSKHGYKHIFTPGPASDKVTGNTITNGKEGYLVDGGQVSVTFKSGTIDSPKDYVMYNGQTGKGILSPNNTLTKGSGLGYHVYNNYNGTYTVNADSNTWHGSLSTFGSVSTAGGVFNKAIINVAESIFEDAMNSRRRKNDVHALSLFKRLVDDHGDLFSAQRALTEINEIIGKGDNGTNLALQYYITLYSRLKNSPIASKLEPFVADHLVFWLRTAGKYDAALSLYEELINNRANNEEALGHLLDKGRMLYFELGRKEEGIRALQQAAWIESELSVHVVEVLNEIGVPVSPIPLEPIVQKANSGDIPMEFGLSQNFPNPFNPTTQINYSIESPGLVNISVFNVLGHKIATLVNEAKTAGFHSVKFDASHLASGTYFYRLTTGGFTDVKRMILIK